MHWKSRVKIRVNQFIEFAYGDKRRDKAKVRDIIDSEKLPYDPAKDRYKKFRDAMTAFENQKILIEEFQELHSKVSPNKSAAYKILCENYLSLKEDNALIWQGKIPVEADIKGLCITTSWYLRTEESNQRKIIFLNFGKDQFPMKKERGLLAILRIAKPDAAGVGILNIQPGTLTTATRLNEVEAKYLHDRAQRFAALAVDIQKGS